MMGEPLIIPNLAIEPNSCDGEAGRIKQGGEWSASFSLRG